MGPSLTVAFLAGCANVLITNPIWVVATRMQVTLGTYTPCLQRPISIPAVPCCDLATQFLLQFSCLL